MNFGIRKKLILAFVGTSLLLTAVIFLSVWFSFRAGFLQYVNDGRYSSLQQIAKVVNNRIGNAADWQKLISRPERWKLLLERHRLETIGDGEPLERHTSLKGKNLEAAQHRDPSFRPPPPRKRGHRKPPPFQRFLLLDNQKAIIFGRLANIESLWLEKIEVDGQLVGYVGLKKLVSLNNRADQLFASQQRRYFLFIALVSVILSVVIAYLLSSFLTSPIKKVVKAMSAVARRDYSAKVDYSSSDEVGQLVQSFNQLTLSLGQHEKAQNQWITDISHELRTPLTALRGELEAVQDGVRELNNKRIDSIHEEVLRLQRIVDDLHQLSLSDLGAMRYRFEPVMLVNLLSSLLEGQREELAKHSLNLAFNITGNEKAVYGDADRLQQVFHNLLQNTIRYTDANEPIEITLDFQSQDLLTLTWEDGSPGVTSESITQLFDRLYRQESSRNREQGGSGLGLSICKNIINAHSGNIFAEGAVLGGLKIIITLPYAK